MQPAKRVFVGVTQHPCTENAMNSNLLKRWFQTNGWEVTTENREADLIIVSTCGFNKSQEDYEIEQCRRFGIVPYGYFVVGFDTDDEAAVGAVFDYIVDRRLIAQVLPVGIMNRDEDGEPMAEAGRVLSDTSFGATVFVSHRPARLSAPRLQQLINRGYRRITSLRRLRHVSTGYERAFLFGFNRCFAVWEPAMQRHVEHLSRLTGQRT